MFKASITIHKSPKGKLTVLSCSENADKAVNSYVGCSEEGEVQLIIRGRIAKQKKVSKRLKRVSTAKDK
jgi:hypothetical protein